MTRKQMFCLAIMNTILPRQLSCVAFNLRVAYNRNSPLPPTLSGLGWALVFTPAVASVMQYFTRRRSLAMALGFTGIGLSSFAFSPLFQLLVEEYAWRGALLILGAMSLNIVACGALIRPIGRGKVLAQVRQVTRLHYGSIGFAAENSTCNILSLKSILFSLANMRFGYDDHFMTKIKFGIWEVCDCWQVMCDKLTIL